MFSMLTHPVNTMLEVVRGVVQHFGITCLFVLFLRVRKSGKQLPLWQKCSVPLLNTRTVLWMGFKVKEEQQVW